MRGQKSPTNVGGVLDDGTPFQPSNVHAFQVAWFNVLAARLGYAGTIKWDAFVAKYDNTAQDYSLMGSATDGWPLRPAYRLLQLFTATVASRVERAHGGRPAGRPPHDRVPRPGRRAERDRPRPRRRAS